MSEIAYKVLRVSGDALVSCILPPDHICFTTYRSAAGEILPAKSCIAFATLTMANDYIEIAADYNFRHYGDRPDFEIWSVQGDSVSPISFVFPIRVVAYQIEEFGGDIAELLLEIRETTGYRSAILRGNFITAWDVPKGSVLVRNAALIEKLEDHPYGSYGTY